MKPSKVSGTYKVVEHNDARIRFVFEIAWHSSKSDTHATRLQFCHILLAFSHITVKLDFYCKFLTSELTNILIFIHDCVAFIFQVHSIRRVLIERILS